MSRFPRVSRATFVALGLAVLLLADGLATLPDHVVRAAKGETTGQQSSVADVVVCAPGFDDVETKPGMSLHGVARVPKGAIAVGYARRSLPGHNGVRVPATLINRGKGWTRLPTASAGDEDGLMAVASRGGEQAWAVGFTTIKSEVKPLAMRWNGKRWVTDRPRVGAPVAVLTDVDIVKGGSPFVVGYRMTAGGKRKPLVLRKDGPRWRSIPMRTSDRGSVTLTGVGSNGRNGTWVVGHGGAGSAVKPLIYLRDKGRWTSVRVPAIKGEAALADVVAAGPRDSWAVGYLRRGGKAHPLVLRWNGTRWKRAEAPSFDSNEALLSAVSVDPAGGIWVVGAAWDDERKEFEAVAAWWDGRAWNETVGRTGGNELNDVVGSLRENGWAVGRSNGAGRVARVCLPPQSGVFGSSEAPASQGSTGTGGADEADELAPGSTAFEDDPEALDADDLETFETQGEAADERSANLRRKGKKAGKATGKIGTLPPATTDKRIVARDVARPAGIYEDTGTYGAVVEDFDGDGDEDLFIGRHGRKGKLYLNDAGIFREHWHLKMPAIDRHGCTTADIDGSGLPDLYCAVGGKRGSGLKSNELWLDPGSKDPREVASVRGVADPTGRGRLSAFLDAGRRGATDLVVTNSPARVDGLPSLTRLFRADGDGRFKARARTGVVSRQGARAIQAADFDGDGREDLLLVTGSPMSPEPGRTKLYRNTRKGLVDVTRKMGLRAFDELDAELVDLNRDGRLDLVQLSPSKLMVSLQKKGRFKKVFERNLTNGRAIASGDVNGDQRGDLYLVRSGDKNYPDVMLVNRDNGRKWSSLVIPQVFDGGGDDAYAIDHDRNGLDDFVVLNGHNERGPTQLIAFYPR